MFHTLLVIDPGADDLCGVQNHLFWVRASVTETIIIIMKIYIPKHHQAESFKPCCKGVLLDV